MGVLMSWHDPKMLPRTQASRVADLRIEEFIST
jgi:hypothetical protein